MPQMTRSIRQIICSIQSDHSFLMLRPVMSIPISFYINVATDEYTLYACRYNLWFFMWRFDNAHFVQIFLGFAVDVVAFKSLYEDGQYIYGC